MRAEFIDPFFEALGWDVRNLQGYAEPYKDVVHEDTVKLGEATRAPDYCFRIGGTRKFFVEAKKPVVAVRHEHMVALVQQMLDLHKKLAPAAVPADRALYQRQVETTDRQIDALVCELYGLSDEEIAIVEGAGW